MDLVNDTWQSLRRDNNGFDLDLGLEAFIESMNLSVSPDLFSLRELPAKASSLGVQETTDTPAVLPVDQNKNTAINNQVVSASVPNRTTPGLFEKYFPRGIFS